MATPALTGREPSSAVLDPASPVRESPSEVVDILRTLIRFDTSNPPGNERPAAEFLADLLRSEGIDTVLREPAPGRTSVVARLKGSGAARPLLLSAHLDVVPATGPEWTHAPFAADVHDGYVWGRGAVDMKAMAAMSAFVLLELRRRRVPLRRDVIFAGVADEEEGGRLGAAFLVDAHPELIDAEFCFTEVGGWTVPMPRATLVPIQIAERGFEWLRVRTHGAGGHGSLPTPGSAIDRLAAAVARLSRHRLGHHLTPSAGDFLRALEQAMGPVPGLLLRGLRSPLTAALVLRLLPANLRPAITAMVFNTAVPTALSGGGKVNVVPAEAEALIDGRYLPGVSPEQFLRDLRRVLGPGLDVESLAGGPPIEQPFESEATAAIRRVLGRRIPNVRIVPYLLPGMTDARHYVRAGIRTYGFTPVALGKDEPFTELYHAPDERIGVAALNTGSSWLYDVVVELAAIDVLRTD